MPPKALLLAVLVVAIVAAIFLMKKKPYKSAATGVWVTDPTMTVPCPSGYTSKIAPGQAPWNNVCWLSTADAAKACSAATGCTGYMVPDLSGTSGNTAGANGADGSDPWGLLLTGAPPANNPISSGVTGAQGTAIFYAKP